MNNVCECCDDYYDYGVCDICHNKAIAQAKLQRTKSIIDFLDSQGEKDIANTIKSAYEEELQSSEEEKDEKKEY